VLGDIKLLKADHNCPSAWIVSPFDHLLPETKCVSSDLKDIEYVSVDNNECHHVACGLMNFQ
jgi:hypothetical protein